MRSYTKFGSDQFSRFDVYWIQTNRHPSKQTKKNKKNTQASKQKKTKKHPGKQTKKKQKNTQASKQKNKKTPRQAKYI